MTIPINKWDARFIRLAEEARTWTKGLETGIDVGVGACVVSPDKRRFSLGYAGLPRGVEDTVSRLTSQGYKDHLMVHAELNAILNAACSLADWTLYSTMCPCAGCAAAVIQSGITRVVSPGPVSHSRWAHSSLEGADAMKEAGITVHRYGEA